VFWATFIYHWTMAINTETDKVNNNRVSLLSALTEQGEWNGIALLLRERGQKSKQEGVCNSFASSLAFITFNPHPHPSSSPLLPFIFLVIWYFAKPYNSVSPCWWRSNISRHLRRHRPNEDSGSPQEAYQVSEDPFVRWCRRWADELPSGASQSPTIKVLPTRLILSATRPSWTSRGHNSPNCFPEVLIRTHIQSYSHPHRRPN